MQIPNISLQKELVFTDLTRTILELIGGVSHSLEACHTQLTFLFVGPFLEILASCTEELESFRFFVCIFHFMPHVI